MTDFQNKYAIWDFGENYTAGKNYPHDNFVYNMNEEGFQKMKKTLEDYIRAVEIEQGKNENKRPTPEKSIGEFVVEDPSVLYDTLYFKSVEALLEKARGGQTLEK